MTARDDLLEAMLGGHQARPPMPPSHEIATFAQAALDCLSCQVPAGSACTAPRPRWQTVCKQRYAVAAMEVANERKRRYPAAGGHVPGCLCAEHVCCALCVSARLDLAEARHVFTSEVPDADVQERVRQIESQATGGEPEVPDSAAPSKRNGKKAARRNSLNRRRENASQSRTLNPWPRAGEVTVRQMTPQELAAHQERLAARRGQRSA